MARNGTEWCTVVWSRFGSVRSPACARDLKPGNVLVENSYNKVMKICDFGLARFARPSDMTGFVGTPQYMAP
jgi:serine/threonine protein kinase